MAMTTTWRELQKARDEARDRAQEIHNRSVSEKRDLRTDEEEEFNRCIDAAENLTEKMYRKSGYQIDFKKTTKAMPVAERMANASKLGGRQAPPIIPGSTGVDSHRSHNRSAFLSYWTDNWGNPIVCLNREQRMADLFKDRLDPWDRDRPLSMGKVCRELATGNWHGAETEQRALQLEGTAWLGGFMVQDILAADFIDLMRANSVVFKAGAQLIPMVEGDRMSIVRVEADPTFEVKDEGAAYLFTVLAL